MFAKSLGFLVLASVVACAPLSANAAPWTSEPCTMNEKKIVCRTVVKVTISAQDKCTAKGTELDVRRNELDSSGVVFPTLMLFVIHGPPLNADLKFDPTDGIYFPPQANDSLINDHFERLGTLNDRVFMIKNKNPSGRIDFEYKGNIYYKGVLCDFA